jgi:hypothetical protein
VTGTNYAFYAAEQTRGASNYAFYSAGTTPSSLGGSLNVGSDLTVGADAFTVNGSNGEAIHNYSGGEVNGFSIFAESLTSADALYLNSSSGTCDGCALIHAEFDGSIPSGNTAAVGEFESLNNATSAGIGIALQVTNTRMASIASGTDRSYGIKVNSSNAQDNTGGNPYTYGVHSTATGSAGGSSIAYGGWFNATGAGTNYGVYADGTSYDFYAAGSGTDYGTSSSVRWKRNIKEIDGALDMVLGMRGVYYDWDEAHGGYHSMGFIAEEVMEYVPEIVQEDPDAPGFATGMDYGHMTPILVQAVKDLYDIALVKGEDGGYSVESGFKATPATLAVDSPALSLVGSRWNASTVAVEESEFKLVNSVAEGEGTLSVLNTLGTSVMAVSQEGDLSVNGRLFLSDRGAMQSDAYLYYDSGSPLGGYVRTSAAGFGTGSYDFAETFPSGDTLEAGEIVMIDVNADEAVRRADDSSASNGYLLAGVVSTRPGFLAGTTDVGHYPVALQGRVPTRVNLENGPIRIGDPIAVSATPGEGMKADPRNYVVGIALQSYDPSTGSGQAGSGMITVFLKVGWFNGESVEAQVESVAGTITTEISGPVDFKSQPLIGIGAMEGAGGKWSIDSEGKLVTSEVRADKLVAKETTVAIDDETQMVGEGAIAIGNSEVRVLNSAVKPNSRVFVTFFGNVEGTWWIAERMDGEFLVRLSKVAATDLRFEYWIVNVEDNRTVIEDTAPPAEEPATTSAEEPPVVADAAEETVPPIEAPATSVE